MLPDIAPTGKRVKIPLVAIVRFRDGKLAREHIYFTGSGPLSSFNPACSIRPDFPSPERSAQKARFPRSPPQIYYSPRPCDLDCIRLRFLI